MRVPGSTYTTTWFEVRDENGEAIRRFLSLEEANNFAQDSWTIEKITLTKQLFVPEEAPF